ncbi:MAG: hypothetical protein AAB584_02310 [Patescibacteria group bacterium]
MNDLKANITKGIFVVIGGLLFVAAGAWITGQIRKEEVPPKKEIVSCPTDRLSYNLISQNQNQVIKLIPERKQMFAENGEFINLQVVITKSETKDSKIACGYLFVRVGTQTYGALQDWENIYINPNQFGGHIYSKSAFSINEGKDFSEYIYSLDKIQYWRSRNEQNILNADWASLLNVSPEISFIIALNTEDKAGFIDELSIAYKCWNPTTGEENTGCKLNIKDSSVQKTPEL